MSDIHSQELVRQISHVRKAQDKGEKTGTTLFSSLLNQGLPSEETTSERLQHEALSILMAGTEATMRSLTIACFYILKDQTTLQRLVAELTAAIPDLDSMPDWDTLTKLPFLSACIEETLRLSYGTAHRIQRAYSEGTLVSKSSVRFQNAS